jgi:hypothetical protein
MALRGALDALGAGYIPFDGKIDVAYFLDQPNAEVARRALSFLADQVNEIELHKRHSSAEVESLWRGTLRSCVAHGVELTPDQRLYAVALGIVP